LTGTWDALVWTTRTRLVLETTRGGLVRRVLPIWVGFLGLVSRLVQRCALCLEAGLGRVRRAWLVDDGAALRAVLGIYPERLGALGEIACCW